ncbi:DUF99 family protein [Candidatus Woesearchaeota archaeon]|nr:DUF99 family protein [Candidatus Woesearchaeota archaeon]
MLKKQIRVLGIDDSPFNKFEEKKVLVVAALFRGGEFLDGVMSTYVKIDGPDSTSKLIKMINKCKFKPQLHAILLDGIAFGGFNIIDIEELCQETNIPVIVVIRNYPDFDKIGRALIKIKQEEKIELLKKAGEVHSFNKIFFQAKGCPLDKAREILKVTTTHAYIPEPLRVAHLIGAGIVYGESRGRA